VVQGSWPLLKCLLRPERGIRTRGSCSRVGMLRLRPVSAALHPGSAQHEITLGSTEIGQHYFLNRHGATQQ
jgi:hypothetical protein